MKKLLQTSTLVLVLILTLSSALADISTANTLMDEGNYSAAVTELEGIIESEPENIEALYTLASALTSLAATIDDPTEAEATYDTAARTALKVVELDPTEAQGPYQRARALGRLAQFRGILQSLFMAGDIKGGFEKAIELDDQLGGAYHGLAAFHAEAPFIVGGDSSKAGPLFEKAIELDPTSPLRYLEYAEMLIKQEKLDEAKIQLDQLLTLEAKTSDDANYIERGKKLFEENF